MKKILIFVLTFLLIFCVAIPAQAQEYGNTLPDYCYYSGGGYCEIESSLGSCTFVVPAQYKDGYFSFSGSSGYNIYNCSNSTITGRLITSTGTEYGCRFSSWGTLQIYEAGSSGYGTTYTDVTVANILNTNIIFIDNTESDRQSDEVFTKYDFTYNEKFYICIFVIATVLVIISNLKKRSDY